MALTILSKLRTLATYFDRPCFVGPSGLVDTFTNVTSSGSTLTVDAGRVARPVYRKTAPDVIIACTAEIVDYTSLFNAMRVLAQFDTDVPVAFVAPKRHAKLITKTYPWTTLRVVAYDDDAVESRLIGTGLIAEIWESCHD